MSDHPTPPDGPIESAVDRRLTTAVRAARTSTPGIDRNAFLATAQTRRNRVRRRRRVRIVATPIVAAAIIVTAIGLIVSNRDRGPTSLATVTRPEAPVSASRPIRVLPDRGLADGDTVQVAAYAAVEATISQCAIVRTPDDQRYYACIDNPADHRWNVQGEALPGVDADTPVAIGYLKVHEHLTGRLYLLSYPDGGETQLTSQPSDVSCTSDTIPTVTPVSSGTDTDTTAPATSMPPTSSRGQDDSMSGSRCVVMATGLFLHVWMTGPPVAPISFAGAHPEMSNGDN